MIIRVKLQSTRNFYFYSDPKYPEVVGIVEKRGLSAAHRLSSPVKAGVSSLSI